jgi:hypothetical protein
VVLHRLDHHPVLLLGVRHLHPPRPPDPRVRHVPVAADLVASVHDHDPLAQLVRAEPAQLPDRRRLADAGAAQEQD